MKVKNAVPMSTVCIPPDTPLPEIAKAMARQEIGAIPVGENNSLIGMVTDRDIVCRAVASGRDLSGMTARDVMTKIAAHGPGQDDREEAPEIERKRSGAFPSTAKERQWWAL